MGLRVPRGGGSGGGVSAPVAPTGVSATALDVSRANVAWSDASSNEDGFEILTNGTHESYQANGATSHIVTGLTANTAYTFSVRSFRAATSANVNAAATTHSSYRYGHPTAGTAEPNVAAQFIFEEASGDIVDAVNALAVPDVGTPTYSVTASGVYADLGTGITTSAGNMFLKGSNTAELAIGTNDFTIEFWYKTTQATGSPMLWEHDDEAAVRGYYAQGIASSGVFSFAFTNGAGAGFTKNFGLTPGTWNDGNPHKIRLVGDRSALLSLYFDGTLIGSYDISGYDGATYNAGFASFGAYPFTPFTAAPFNGTYYEWRLSLNATNNSGGVNGG